LNKYNSFKIKGVKITAEEAAVIFRQTTANIKFLKFFGGNTLSDYLSVFEESPDYRDELVGVHIVKSLEWVGLVKPFISHPVPSIIDIGCGIGIVDLIFARSLDYWPEVYLFDKSIPMDMSNPTPLTIGGYHKTNYEFSANLSLAKEFLIRNDYPAKKIHLCEVGSFDLRAIKVSTALSVRSWGFHYPVEMYLDDIVAITDNLVILDVRKGINLNKLHSIFSEIVIAKDDPKSQMLVCRK